MNKYFPIRFLLLAFVVFFYSCGASKKTATTPPPTTAAEMTFEQVRDSMLRNIPACSALTAKGDIEFNSSSGNSGSFSFHMRMRRDSVIWLSIFPILGIALPVEVARILLTPDSIKALDKIHNVYYSDGYNAVNMLANADLDFAMLQSLLLAGYFPSRPDTLRSLYVENPHYLLTTIEKKNQLRNEEASSTLPFTWDIWLSPADNRIHKMHIAEPVKQKNVKIDYSDFRDTGAGILPYRQDLNMADEARQKTAQVIITFTKVTPVENVDFPFSIPRDFEHKQLVNNR
jgi:hypothetical protein